MWKKSLPARWIRHSTFIGISGRDYSNRSMKLSLRLLNLPVGLLINFGTATFKEGIRRVVNNYQDFASSRLRMSQKVGGTRRREDAKGDSSMNVEEVSSVALV